MYQAFNALPAWIYARMVSINGYPLSGISICPRAAPRFGCGFDFLWGDRSLCRPVLQRSKTRRTRRQAPYHGSHLQWHVSCRANGTLVGSGRCAKVGYLCDYGADGRFFFFPVHAHKAGDGVFSLEKDGFIKLVNLNSNTTTNLVQISNLVDVSLVDGLPLARVALDHVHIVGARQSAGLVHLEAVA
jgi:hypothetical protein